MTRPAAPPAQSARCAAALIAAALTATVAVPALIPGDARAAAVSGSPAATATGSPAAAATSSACAAANLTPPVRVKGRGRVQVYAMQYRELVDQMASYASIRRYLNCWFARYLRHRDPRVPGLVVFNELTGLAFALAGSRGAPARAFDTTPAATAGGQASNEPLGALGGAIGLTAAAYSGPLAYYAAKFPQPTAAELSGEVTTVGAGGVAVPADRVFLAATDTYVRAFIGTFSALARRYRVTVVAGAPLPVLTSRAACAAHGYPGWVACPGWRATTNPAAVAALADPDLAAAYASGRLTSVYEAVTPKLRNAAFFFDPRGRLYDIQPKVNLTPIEQELGWTPAPMSTVHPVRLRTASGRPVPGVRLGVAISLDAFENRPAAHPCRHRQSYVACLARRRVNVLLQPEFNDGVANCASWSDYSAPCRTTPVWQQLEWMTSSWYAVRARRRTGGWLYPSFRYAVNPFMVGNLYDITGDGQSAIVARSDPRARKAAYVGDLQARRYRHRGPGSPYPDPATVAPQTSLAAPMTYRALDGAHPGFLAVAPWVLTGRNPARGNRDVPSLPAGDPRSLQSCEHGLAPGSGVRQGRCAENQQVATALVAKLRLPRPRRPR